MYRNQNKGIGAGIISGVFWGTPFVVPMILHSYSAIEITLGRFVFFGIISLFFIKRVLKLFFSLNNPDKLMILILGTTGFWLYTLVLASGVQISGGVMASLIIGSLPVTITIFSSPSYNKKFIIGIMLIIVGLIVLLMPNFSLLSVNKSQVNLSGIIYLLVALTMWTWFAIKNSHFMVTHPEINSIDYSSLIGIVNLICIIPIYLYHNSFSQILNHDDLCIYLISSIIVGVGASWVANVFWAYSAKNCSSTIAGTLIVSETVFGLVYSFIYECRLPVWNESISIILLICGVIVVISSQRRKNIH